MNLALRVGFYDESWKQKEIPHVIWQFQDENSISNSTVASILEDFEILTNIGGVRMYIKRNVRVDDEQMPIYAVQTPTR
jgi:hypothetical protein